MRLAFAWAALWGLAGAFVYASSRLITAILGETELGPRAVKRAWAEFAVALLFGPIAAAALTPPILGRLGQAATLPAVALAIGLCGNAVWPVFVAGLVPAFRRALARWLAELSAALGGEDDRP